MVGSAHPPRPLAKKLPQGEFFGAEGVGLPPLRCGYAGVPAAPDVFPRPLRAAAAFERLAALDRSHPPRPLAKKLPQGEFFGAEGVGFEPTVGFPTPVFKTGALDHSTTPPLGCAACAGICPRNARLSSKTLNPYTKAAGPAGWPGWPARSGRRCRQEAGRSNGMGPR